MVSKRFPDFPSGQDSTLPLNGARVQSLDRELRSSMLRGGAKKKSKISHDILDPNALIKISKDLTVPGIYFWMATIS